MMTKGKSLADLTSRVDAAAAARPLPAQPSPPAPAIPATVPMPAPMVAPDPVRRYTAELPDSLHRQLKHFVVDERTTNYAVNRALVHLLVTDPQLAQRVREMLNERP